MFYFYGSRILRADPSSSLGIGVRRSRAVNDMDVGMLAFFYFLEKKYEEAMSLAKGLIKKFTTFPLFIESIKSLTLVDKTIARINAATNTYVNIDAEV